uniref:Uncharacterized protein n=1 Tax=Romanomermis culicivorax TaxID=13658 RepID=A0A915IYL5_ROMCU
VKEPVYAYTEVGTWPEARRILVKLFTNDSKKTSVYFKTFKTACLEARLEPLPADEDLRLYNAEESSFLAYWCLEDCEIIRMILLKILREYSCLLQYLFSTAASLCDDLFFV